MLKVTALIGNPKPLSRTTQVAQEVQSQVVAQWLEGAGPALDAALQERSAKTVVAT